MPLANADAHNSAAAARTENGFMMGSTIDGESSTFTVQ
jgi:hypothetical protein